MSPKSSYISPNILDLGELNIDVTIATYTLDVAVVSSRIAIDLVKEMGSLNVRSFITTLIHKQTISQWDGRNYTIDKELISIFRQCRKHTKSVMTNTAMVYTYLYSYTTHTSSQKINFSNLFSKPGDVLLVIGYFKDLRDASGKNPSRNDNEGHKGSDTMV